MNQPDTSRTDETYSTEKKLPPPPPTFRRIALNKVFVVGQAANIDGIPVIVRKVTAKEIVFRSVAVPPGFKVEA